MPYIRRLLLSEQHRDELESVRDHHPLAHLREKAAALLKVAAGEPAARVAQTGLLKAHDPDTVYRWINRYQQQGIAGLLIQPGRGRKAAFSPSAGRSRPATLADDPASNA